MVPQEFSNFFATSAGASAALIGLLFVTVSKTEPHSVFGSEAWRVGVPVGVVWRASSTSRALSTPLGSSMRPTPTFPDSLASDTVTVEWWGPPWRRPKEQETYGAAYAEGSLEQPAAPVDAPDYGVGSLGRA